MWRNKLSDWWPAQSDMHAWLVTCPAQAIMLLLSAAGLLTLLLKSGGLSLFAWLFFVSVRATLYHIHLTVYHRRGLALCRQCNTDTIDLSLYSSSL